MFIKRLEFNFVGKLLGPKGNSMKRLQEDTMTKMAVLGRGSMKDKQKEEELRLSMDPKYAHLSDDLHVEIAAFAPPAEAHARIAYALAEVRKYLIPDSNDEIRQEQMREMELLIQTVPGGWDARRGSGGAVRGAGGGRVGGGAGARGGRGGRRAEPAAAEGARRGVPAPAACPPARVPRRSIGC
ncbi:Protein held out wings [Gryllus bimaculatus]|nr:Protein held out wings [Gryllus bimaculatus]